MKSIFATLRQRLAGIGQAYRRFPVAILLVIGLFIYLILNEYRMDQLMQQVEFGRLLLTWIYAILLAFLIGVMTERPLRKPWAKYVLYLIGLAIVVAVYFLVFDTSNYLFVSDGLYVYLGLTLATLLGIFLEPSLRPGQRVPFKAVEVMNSFAWTGLFSFVIGVGTFLVFVMINSLFEVNLRLDRFARVIFEATMLLFAVPFFLSGLQPAGQTKEGTYDPLFRRLLRYVCLPLAFTYTAILYVYCGKILLTQTWPQGLVSHLVLWYSLFVIAVYIFLRADKAKLPKLLDVFPLIVIPLIFMMFGSIGQRIQQYGFTPNRYFIVIAGIWALFGLAYLGFRKRYSPWILMATLIAFILIGTNSPIGAYDVSVRSQKAILNDLLVEQDMLNDNQVVPKDVSEEARQRISATVLWFVNQRATSELTFLPADYQMNDFEEVFGFQPDYDYARDYTHQYTGFYAKPDFSLEVGPGKLVMINLMGQMINTVDGVQATRLENQIELKVGEEISYIPMDFLLELESDTKGMSLPMKELQVGNYTVFIQNASGRIDDGKLILQDAAFFVFIPAKK